MAMLLGGLGLGERRHRMPDNNFRNELADVMLIAVRPSVIVWDLETVPDLTGFAAANDLVGKPEADIREVLGNKFPKHIYHTIVCIGALVVHREIDHWAVDALGAPHVGERSEKQLIASFCDKIAELKPQLVTFNGSSFDLPVLRYRAMIHGVSAPGLAARGPASAIWQTSSPLALEGAEIRRYSMAEFEA
jgi:Predicted 3'-5' exonuclease related to the exonuclease domain of PolB